MIKTMMLGSGNSLEDALMDAIMGIGSSSGRFDERQMHEQAMERIIRRPVIAALEPITKRTVTKIDSNTIHLSPEGFETQDPHTLILVRNPTNETKWRFYSLCPRSRDGVTSYRLRGDEATVIRLASVIIDIGLSIIDVSKIPLDDDDDEKVQHDFGGETPEK